ncbi:MAG: UDP-N-acetylmuramoyl-tripeptide--D-alanyl-D-alanine ligase [bacterium]
MKKIVEKILKILAAAVVKKYRPFIIGVTGSMGKTSTKEAVFAVLSKKFSVRRNIKNYNNEIGVPLTILGRDSGGRSPFKWLAVFFAGLRLLYSKNEYPQILILEMGADKPGDLKYLVSFVDPNIGVITGIGDVPVHIEFFKSPVQVAREKARLIEFLKADDFAILNFDDKAVSAMAGKTKAKVLTYGFGEGAKVRATNYLLNIGFDPSLSGISFKIEYDGKAVPVRLDGILGEHQVYPMLAATCVGLAKGMNLLEIIEGLKNYKAPKGRMQMLEGIKHTWILDDSYNASPAATLAALETLAKFEGRRKIAVLGDMLELGEFTEEMHRQIGEKASRSADFFFAVGERMKFAGQEAQAHGMARQKVSWFEVADEARMPLQMTIQKGDIILIKGSQSMRMEKIVEEIMAEPENASELLVRQEEKWKSR